ncbi:ATP-binding protein [Streptomyces sp. NPDC055992]|uniref:ATP-binding protein n=1 Tax=Streptomyces sp. NPDC055992 TaxID=3345673 RepID=UPI0035DD12A9
MSTTAPPRTDGYTLEVTFTPQPSHVGSMRRIAAAFLGQRSVPASVAEEVVLCVSELVTNAIEHGRGLVSMRLRDRGWELHVEIGDDSSAPARLCRPMDDCEGGRGLLIVAALAQSWGVSDDGRATWATFRTRLGRSS